MDIAWFGASCFRVQHRNTTVFIDPFRLDPRYQNLKLRAHAQSFSTAPLLLGLAPRTVEGFADPPASDPYTIDRPGEYEIGGIFIDAWSANRLVDPGPTSLIFRLFADRASIAHLGQLTSVPDDSVLNGLRHVGALIVPPGGRGALEARQLSQIISKIDPQWVVPMGYAAVDELTSDEQIAALVADLGLEQSAEQSSLNITAAPSAGQGPSVIARLRRRAALKKSAAA